MHAVEMQGIPSDRRQEEGADSSNSKDGHIWEEAEIYGMACLLTCLQTRLPETQASAVLGTPSPYIPTFWWPEIDAKGCLIFQGHLKQIHAGIFKLLHYYALSYTLLILHIITYVKLCIILSVVLHKQALGSCYKGVSSVGPWHWTQ